MSNLTHLFHTAWEPSLRWEVHEFKHQCQQIEARKNKHGWLIYLGILWESRLYYPPKILQSAVCFSYGFLMKNPPLSRFDASKLRTLVAGKKRMDVWCVWWLRPCVLNSHDFLFWKIWSWSSAIPQDTPCRDQKLTGNVAAPTRCRLARGQSASAFLEIQGVVVSLDTAWSLMIWL